MDIAHKIIIWIKNIILGYIMFCYLMQIFKFIKFLIKSREK